ncbi:hypothetical protein D918_05267 [Trichuris suis]|nr:hypothetical protein D918_05267 [Trichuris suis]
MNSYRLIRSGQSMNLKNTEKTISDHRAAQAKEFEPILSKIFEQFQIRYRQYESQHLEFVRYTEQQIENITKFTMNPIPPGVNLTSSTNYNLDPRLNSFNRQPPPAIPAEPPDAFTSASVDSRSLLGTCPPGYASQTNQSFPQGGSGEAHSHPLFFNPPPPNPMFHGGNGQFEPQFYPGSFQRPPAVPHVPMDSGNFHWQPRDMNRFQFAGPVGSMPPAWNERFVMPFIVNMPPPKLVAPKPGLPTTPAYQSSSLKPRCMYYDLPAGVMVPMVPLDAQDYEPIDPHAVRVPMPVAPTERLIAALDGFYNQPRHDAPREFEGWEKLGMYEYYVAKDKAVAARFQREKGVEERNRCVNSLMAEYSQPATSEASS